MNNQTFYNDVQRQVAQFIHAFDDTVISRIESDGTIQQNIEVGYVYAPKSATLHHIVNKADTIKFPIVAVWVTGITRDVNRVFNKIQGHYADKLAGFDSGDFSKSRNILQPVPIDIAISMSIMTRFGSDMDQIVANFVPNCDPYIIISWQRKELEGIEMRNPVIWNGTLTHTYPTDYNLKDLFKYEVSTSFIIKGWMFKKDAGDVGKIYKVSSDISAHKEILTYAGMEEEKSLSGNLIVDQLFYNAAPKIEIIQPFKLSMNSWNYTLQNKTITVYGTGFEKIDSVYLNGGGYTLSSYDLFLSSHSLSSDYPSFDGFKLLSSEFEILSDTKMEITIPQPLTVGYYDIILKSEAGYGKLIGDYVLSSVGDDPIYKGMGITERYVSEKDPHMFVDVPIYHLSGFEIY